MTERTTINPSSDGDLAPRKALQVLVIEDDDVTRTEIVGTLVAQGFQVTEAGNGRAGLWRLWDGRPDIILCDLLMPVMDGLEVLDAIRNRPEWATIPFVFLTSCDDRASMRRAMETGADDYVTKPFEPRELVSALRAPENRRPSRREPAPDQFRTRHVGASARVLHLLTSSRYAEVFSPAARRRGVSISSARHPQCRASAQPDHGNFVL
jgi:CheY-like chemotaxis protein